MPVVASLLPPVITAVNDAAKMLVEESRRPGEQVTERDVCRYPSK